MAIYLCKCGTANDSESKHTAPRRLMAGGAFVGLQCRDCGQSIDAYDKLYAHHIEEAFRIKKEYEAQTKAEAPAKPEAETNLAEDTTRKIMHAQRSGVEFYLETAMTRFGFHPDKYQLVQKTQYGPDSVTLTSWLEARG